MASQRGALSVPEVTSIPVTTPLWPVVTSKERTVHASRYLPSKRSDKRRRAVKSRVAIGAVALAVPAGAALSAAPAPASYAGTYTDAAGQTVLLYYAEFFDGDFGRDNSVAVSAGGNPVRYTVNDGTSGMNLSAGPGCARDPTAVYEAVCPDAGIARLEMFFGDGNDTGGGPVGGAARAFLDGGNGDDALSGGAHADLLHGGSGDDTLRGYADSDQLYGDGGSDKLIGGQGYDYAHYDGSSVPVTVSLDGAPNDGAAGESGNADTEAVWGGSAGDELTGNDGPNVLDGNGGDDVLDGRGGADTL
jgi:Ca2+-binding RTX toxin-like protein